MWSARLRRMIDGVGLEGVRLVHQAHRWIAFRELDALKGHNFENYTW